MKGATSAKFRGDSLAQFLVQELLRGEMMVDVTIGGKTYQGAVHNLDFAVGSGYALASVWVKGLPRKDEDDDGEDHVRVALYADGRVVVMPDEHQDD